jgi:hypothetical protein
VFIIDFSTMIVRILLFNIIIGLPLYSYGQSEQKHEIDSTLIQKVEDSVEPDKVLHAEPLYIDLIRDLGARKGENEWNFGMGLTDFDSFDEYELLVEYEFAVIDRLGLEIEVPVFLYNSGSEGNGPDNRIESLKTAIQWTFLVDQDISTSLALGYINEFLFYPINQIGDRGVVEGNLFNPFFVGAKRWGDYFHTLIYTGPRLEYLFDASEWHFEYEMHLNFHYMIPGTGNFAGLEYNQYFGGEKYHGVLRPQIRLDINEHLLLGIVTGIPLDRTEERFSFFMRLIYEPELWD